jgi:DNA-directed RNA polymerase specialized sigma24 family protein
LPIEAAHQVCQCDHASELVDVADLVLSALAQLTSSQRDVIELHVYAGLQLRVVALVLDCPLGTVATQYRTALAALRKTLLREIP